MEQNMKEDIWILVRKDGSSHPVLCGMMFIGREECDIILQSSSADKRHAVIYFDPADKKISIKDLNSITGTYVNDVRIPEQSYIKLKHLDLIRFGYGADVFRVKMTSDFTSVSNSIKNGRHDQSMTQSRKDKEKSLPPRDESSAAKVNTIPDNKIAKKVPEKPDYSTSLHEADSLEDLTQIEMPSSQCTDKINLSNDKNNPCQNSPPSNCKDLLVKNALSENEKTTLISNCESIEDTNMQFKDNMQQSVIALQKKESQEISPVNETIQTAAVIQQNCKNSMKPCINSAAESEKSNSSNSPLAMAFTIAFDNNTPRKKLSIKDSICQFAPRRSADLERSVLRQKVSSKASEVSVKKIPLPVPEHKSSIQTEVEKRNTQERTIEDLEDGWNMIDQKNIESSEAKLSEGASYLIRKMFNGEPKTSCSSNKISSHRLPSVPPVKTTNLINGIQKIKPLSPETKIERQSSAKVDSNEVNDDKSETGTYTVEADQVDPAVEEARQKIDEVFGVLLPAGSGAATYPPIVQRGKEVSSIRSGSPLQRNSLIKHQGNETSDSDSVVRKERSAQLSRPKRQLPTPPIQSITGNDGLLNGGRTQLSHYGTYTKHKGSSKQEYPHHIHNEVSPTEEYKAYQCKGQISTSTDRMSSSLPLNALQLNSYYSKGDQDGLLSQHTPSDTRSEGSPQSQTSPSGTLWRRMPWNSSGSDLELDQSKSETASVLSDISTSTEPSSPSCLSGRNRSDSGPQMKFNRAFALRRARLGLDTEGSPPPGRGTGPKETQGKNLKSGTHMGPPATSLSRQDGGRFSLRLPQSSKRTNVSKSVAKCRNDQSSVSNTASSVKVGHRRMDSDPGKTVFWRKGDGNNTSVSDSEKNQTIIPPFKRSASFCGADELENVKPNSTRSSFPNSSNRSQNVGRSIMYKGKPSNPTSNISQRGHFVKCAETKHVPKIINSNSSSVSSTTPTSISTSTTTNTTTNSSTEVLARPSKSPPHQQNSKQLSALDSLVISAIHQLSVKLRTGARCLLEKEREKYPVNSDSRLMIEEVLPQVVEKKVTDSHGEVSLTRDLSSILKNLKRVEQSLEVLSSLVYSTSLADKEGDSSGPQNYFIVDV